MIPVLYDLTPTCLMPHSVDSWIIDNRDDLFFYTGKRRGRVMRLTFPSSCDPYSFSVEPGFGINLENDTASIFEDLSSIFASITALDLGRYDG